MTSTNSIKSCILQSTDLISASKFLSAIQLLTTSVLPSKPKHARANFLLHSCYLRMGQPLKALPPLLTALSYSPNENKSFLYYGISLVKSQLGKPFKIDLEIAHKLAVKNKNSKVLYLVGNLLLKHKEYPLAIKAYLQLITWKGNDLLVHKQLATCYRKQSQLREAKEQYRIILEGLQQKINNTEKLSPELMRHWFVACGGVNDSSCSVAAPESFVTGLYNKYADKFDDHLLNKLSYRTPTLLTHGLLKQVERDANIIPPFKNVCDLGCGTGLCISALLEAGLVVPSSSSLKDGLGIQDGHDFNLQLSPPSIIGIDLSSAMVEKAREKQLYDVLEVGNMDNVLTKERQFDLVCCCDVYPYVGSLEEPFQRVRSSMKGSGNGFFIFSVEHWKTTNEKETFKINSTGRFIHSKHYIQKVSIMNSFKVLHLESVVLRMNGGQPVNGIICVCRTV
jgi:predicted TPR repeat methyltransferase